MALQVVPHPDQRVEQFGPDLISGEGRPVRRCTDKGAQGFEDGGGRCGRSGDGLFKVADEGEDDLGVLAGVGQRDALLGCIVFEVNHPLAVQEGEVVSPRQTACEAQPPRS